MKILRTIAIISLAAGLLLFYLFFLRANKPVKERPDSVKPAKKEESILGLISGDRVTEVTLRRKGEDIVLKREGNEWKIVRPIMAPAEFFIVDGFLRALSLLKQERTFIPSGGMDEYGLASPRLEVGIRTEKVPQERRLMVGDKEPLGQYYYAAWHGSDKVFFMSENLFASLDKSVYSLRDKQVLKFNQPDVNLIRIVDGDRKILLRLGKNGWFLRAGRRTLKADSRAIDFYMAQLGGIFAKRFCDEKDRKDPSLGFSPQKRWIEIREKGKTSALLVIGSEIVEADGFFAVLKGAGPVIVIAYGKVNDLFKKPGYFSKKTFLKFGELSKLEIEVGGKRCSWESTSAQWGEAEKFLLLLSDLSYEEKMSAAIFEELPLERERFLTVRCFEGKESASSIVEFFLSGGSGFVTVEGDKNAYKVSLVLINEVLNFCRSAMEKK
ncbi:MAG: DUF4340 domain-containing protein [Candidatus Omnitrophica bacterium]|nr:DUF4340 domain-containing protein [Candidatus Omnitrophota bacterium]